VHVVIITAYIVAPCMLL